jgi:hypothetical protein
MITLKSIIAESKVKSVLPVNEAKFYAFFNNKKHEIEGKDLLDAKQKAITMLKVPKSKVGLLAIVNANEHDKGSFRYESVNEAKDETYFKSFTDAVSYARAAAEKRGFEINEDDWQTQIALGGRYSRGRPSIGKTNSFSVGLLKAGKPQRKNLNISVYGMESGKFELTYYIN